MSDRDSVILAIEAAICGGSISLLMGGVEVANWIGSSNVSKAEDLLVNIDAILTAANISRRDIDLIAVSAGPGSFTGIRIGLATALGLKAGLGIEMASDSALKAMVWRNSAGLALTAALPVGRNSICIQTFRTDDRKPTPLDEPRTLPNEDFYECLDNKKDTSFVLHGSLYEKYDGAPLVTNFGINIAFAIGSMCAEYPCVVTEPLFISKGF